MPAADGQAQTLTTNILEVNLGKGKIRGDGGQKAIAGKATMSSPRVGGWSTPVARLLRGPQLTIYPNQRQRRSLSLGKSSGVRILSYQVRAGHTIHGVNVMLDAEDLFTVEPDLHEGFISDRKPEVTDFLVLADEIGSGDPEG